jgi:hypothetical protein
MKFKTIKLCALMLTVSSSAYSAAAGGGGADADIIANLANYADESKEHSNSESANSHPEASENTTGADDHEDINHDNVSPKETTTGRNNGNVAAANFLSKALKELSSTPLNSTPLRIQLTELRVVYLSRIKEGTKFSIINDTEFRRNTPSFLGAKFCLSNTYRSLDREIKTSESLLLNIDGDLLPGQEQKKQLSVDRLYLELLRCYTIFKESQDDDAVAVAAAEYLSPKLTLSIGDLNIENIQEVLLATGKKLKPGEYALLPDDLVLYYPLSRVRGKIVYEIMRNSDLARGLPLGFCAQIRDSDGSIDELYKIPSLCVGKMGELFRTGKITKGSVHDEIAAEEKLLNK